MAIRLNDDVRGDLSDWSGPVDTDARPGTAYVADDPTTGLFFAHIEIDAGPCSAMVDGPHDVSIREVVDWASSRARRVQVRWLGQHYSGGEVRLDLPELPLDEIARPPSVTPDLLAKVRELTEVMRKSETPTMRWLRTAIELAGPEPEHAVVAVLDQSFGGGQPLTAVVTADEQVLALDTELARLARYEPGPSEFDDRLDERWGDSRVRDEVAAALQIVRGEV